MTQIELVGGPLDGKTYPADRVGSSVLVVPFSQEVYAVAWDSWEKDHQLTYENVYYHRDPAHPHRFIWGGHDTDTQKDSR